MIKKVSIRYLIDVAIGNPEPGIVNFNALYTVLQAISEKLDLEDEQIEVDSSFCPVPRNSFDSKSNVSSEKLMEHQVYDIPSEFGKEGQGALSSRSRENFQNKNFAENGKTHHAVSLQDHQNTEDRKVVFGRVESKNKDGEMFSSAGAKKSKNLDVKQHIDSLNDRLGKIENIAVWSIDTEQSVECLRQIVEQVQNKLDSLERTVCELKDKRHAREEDISSCRIKLDFDKLSVVTDGLRKELNGLKDSICLSGSKNVHMMNIPAGTSHDYGEITKFQMELMEFRANVCILNEKLTSLEESAANTDIISSMVTLDTFQQEISSIRAQIENSDIATIQTEQHVLKGFLNELKIQLDEVAKSNLNKEEIYELLSEKVDYSALNQKVSVENMQSEHSKFEKQLSEITECVIFNEEQIQKQINEIKKLVGEESFKDLIQNLKSKVDKEIQTVSNSLKKLSEIKPNIDSAVTRLKDLTCLSCDQNVVMKTMELNNLAKFNDAYMSKSVSPSVAFEMGKLRLARKVGNSSDSEIIFGSKTNIRQSGGVYTIITNKERVSKTRLGKQA